MSLILVSLFIVEFAAWVLTNRNTPFSTPRIMIFQGTTAVAASVAICYLALWGASNQAPFIDLEPVFWFAVINGLVALCTTAALIVRWTCQRDQLA